MWMGESEFIVMVNMSDSKVERSDEDDLGWRKLS